MEATTQLLEQWEPKVHSMLRNVSFRGIEYEDAAQELRISIIKAVRKFQESRGVSFHTFLHIVMLNDVRRLIDLSTRKYPVMTSLDDDPLLPDKIEALQINEAYEILQEPVIPLASGEEALIVLLASGFRIREIRKKCTDRRAVDKIYWGLKKKVASLNFSR